MGDAERRLEQDETLGRVGPIDPPPVLRFHNGFVIQLGLVTEQRQLEAVLAADGAVTVRVGASRLGEDRDDILDEAELRLLRVRSQQQKRHRNRHTAHIVLKFYSSSLAPSPFNSIGGETTPPARRRNQPGFTALDAVTRSSICVSPGPSVLLSNLPPGSAGSGSKVSGVFAPSKRVTSTRSRPGFPADSVRLSGGSSTRAGRS